MNRKYGAKISDLQEVLHALLDAQGFAAMAKGAKDEQDMGRLRRYAQVVVKNTPERLRGDVYRRLALLGLV